MSKGSSEGTSVSQKTQLQFNLGSVPHSSNFATHFDPTNQPPIIINRGAVQTVGFSQTPREAFQAVSPERLSLAVKLARRNIQRNRLSYSGETSSCLTDNHEDATHYTRATQAPPIADKGPVHSHTRLSYGKVRVQSPTPKDARVTTKAAAVDDDVADEIARLKVELQEQLVQLSTANSRRMVDGGGRGMNVPDRGRRGRWGEEDEENEERWQRRRKEQWSRNARMIYDLSQQVKYLEKKTCQKEHHLPGTSEQIEVVKKLAAAQRAALRTLQSFSGKGGGAQDSIPPELSLLVQQLALLSTQLGGGGGAGSSEITASVHQLMKTLEERQRMAKLAQEHAIKNQCNTPERNMPNPKPKNRIKKKGLAHRPLASHTGLLLNPQLQKRRNISHEESRNIHFTHGTISSARRQQPPVVYTTLRSTPSHAVCSTPAYQSTRRPCQLVLACSPTPLQSHKEKEVKKKKKKNNKTGGKVYVAESPFHPTKVRRKEQLWCEEMKEGVLKQDVDEEEDVDENSVDLPSQPFVITENLSSAIAQQADQLELLRKEISQKLTELKVGVVGGQRTSLPHTVPVAPRHHPNLPDTKVSGMLRRLDELEAEEDEIRQRWTSVVYEDPLHSKPSLLLHNKRKNKSQHSPLSNPMILPHLSTQSKEELDEYRHRYEHYLDCTGLSTQGGFNPWEMAERIADELFCEVVEGVAEEVGLLCDGCIDGLYGAEFLRPP